MGEKTIFVNLLGDYPLIRILNHLLIFREFDYSLTDIANESEVAWSTLNLLWPRLEKMKIVKHTRDVGKARMYRLNEENKQVKAMIEFADRLVWDHTHKKMEKKAVVIG